VSTTAEGGATLRAREIGAWQAAVIGVSAVASLAIGRGSPASLLLGGLLMYASLRLTEMAVRIGLRQDRSPAVAIGLFLAKLVALLAVAIVGLTTRWIAPMSLAIGAATLPLAIVLDTCYLARVNRRSSR
jgi:hypothetical protein